MSPEQAAGRPVGPASDIFNLGLNLCAILTGKPAFNPQNFAGVGALDAVRNAEVTPPRKRNSRLPRVLEAVCLRSLAGRPEDRYDSARDLAADLENWLDDEPVSAYREPVTVRVGRWSRQNRTFVISTLAVLGFGVIGLAGFASILAGKNRELDKQRLQAVEQRNLALKAEKTAKNEETKAKNSESESRAMLDFLESKVLAAARPRDWEGGLGIDATIRAALDAAEPGIRGSFGDQPKVEASIPNTLGTSYLYLGDAGLAIRQFERAVAARRQILGPDSSESLKAMNNLAYAYRDAGRFSDALPLLEETLNRSTAVLGFDHPVALDVMNNLAGAYRETNRLDDALRLNEETLRRRKATLGPDHPDTLASLSYVARTHYWAGRFAVAVPLYEETLKRRRAKLGFSHADTLLTMNDLATAYYVANNPRGYHSSSD